MRLFFELLSNESGWDAVEGILRTFVIVSFHPLVCKIANFFEDAEGVGMEDFTSDVAVEAFNVAVLHGWPVGVAPIVKLGRDKLGLTKDRDDLGSRHNRMHKLRSSSSVKSVHIPEAFANQSLCNSQRVIS